MDELKELIDNYKIEKIFDYINSDLSESKKLEKPLVIIYFFDKNCYKKYTKETEAYLNFSKLDIENFHNRDGQKFIKNKHLNFNGIIFKDNDKIIISCLKNGLLKIQFNYNYEVNKFDEIDEIINLYSKKDEKEYYNKINFSYNIIGIKTNKTVQSKNSLGEEKCFNCASIQENRFDVKLGQNSNNHSHNNNQFNDYLIDKLNDIIENLRNYTNS